MRFTSALLSAAAVLSVSAADLYKLTVASHGTSIDGYAVGALHTGAGFNNFYLLSDADVANYSPISTFTLDHERKSLYIPVGETEWTLQIDAATGAVELDGVGYSQSVAVSQDAAGYLQLDGLSWLYGVPHTATRGGYGYGEKLYELRFRPDHDAPAGSIPLRVLASPV